MTDPTRQTGFTLVEMTVAIVVTSLLLVACASAVLLATKALPEASGPLPRLLTAAEIADKICGDLQYATAIMQKTATRLEFQVPDRNGDAQPETISYTWSGAGQPLMYYYNGAGVDLTSGVQSFSLTYLEQDAPDSSDNLVVSVGISLNLSLAASARIDTAAALLNRPEAP